MDSRLPAPRDTLALFESAVRTHSRRLLAIARSIVGLRASPEDVVQQALTNLFEHRDRYDWRQPGGLLRRAVVNEALRLLRGPRWSVVADDDVCGGEPEPDARMQRLETIEAVRSAIDRLPPHFRAALVLCEYENLPYVEIARILQCSIPQVKTWLHRGRKQLAVMLKDHVAGAAPETAIDQRAKP